MDSKSTHVDIHISVTPFLESLCARKIETVRTTMKQICIWHKTDAGNSQVFVKAVQAIDL